MNYDDRKLNFILQEKKNAIIREKKVLKRS